MNKQHVVSRRDVLRGLAAAVPLMNGVSAALAQTPAVQQLDLVRFILGSPPGSTLDIFCRRVAEGLQNTYARTVLVENRTGASGQISVMAVKTAPADGSNLLVTPMTYMGIFPHSYSKLPYDPQTDFVPVSMGALFDLAFAVGPAVPERVKTVPEFIDWCKLDPLRAQFGSPAAGSSPHFLGSMAARAGGVQITHVPYRGPSPAVSDMVGGQISAACSVIGDFLTFANAGRCRILATSGAQRSRFTPNVPTFVEQGYKDLIVSEWFGLFVVARTPPDRIQRLSVALKGVLTDTAVVRGLEDKALEVQWSTPEALAARLKADTEKWRPIVKSFGFTADT